MTRQHGENVGFEGMGVREQFLALGKKFTISGLQQGASQP